MKEKDVKKWYYRSLSGLCCTVIFIVFAYAASVENWPQIIIWIMAILTGISLAASITFWIVWINLSSKQYKEYVQKQKDLSKNEISYESKKVMLNIVPALKCEDFECEAKYNQNGKIFVKIHFDYEREFDSVESFLNYFHFPDND